MPCWQEPRGRPGHAPGALGKCWGAAEDPCAPEPCVRQGQGSVLTHPVSPGPWCPACHPRVRGWPECRFHTATSLGTGVRGGRAGAGCLCLSSLASSSTQGAQAALEAFPGCSVESREPELEAKGRRLSQQRQVGGAAGPCWKEGGTEAQRLRQDVSYTMGAYWAPSPRSSLLWAKDASETPVCAETQVPGSCVLGSYLAGAEGVPFSLGVPRVS